MIRIFNYILVRLDDSGIPLKRVLKDIYIPDNQDLYILAFGYDIYGSQRVIFPTQLFSLSKVETICANQFCCGLNDNLEIVNYMGIEAILDYLLSRKLHLKHITLCLDNLNAVRCINLKSGKYKSIENKMKEFKNLNIRWISKEFNTSAHIWARKGLQEGISQNLKKAYYEYRIRERQHLYKEMKRVIYQGKQELHPLCYLIPETLDNEYFIGIDDEDKEFENIEINHPEFQYENQDVDCISKD